MPQSNGRAGIHAHGACTHDCTYLPMEEHRTAGQLPQARWHQVEGPIKAVDGQHPAQHERAEGASNQDDTRAAPTRQLGRCAQHDATAIGQQQQPPVSCIEMHGSIRVASVHASRGVHALCEPWANLGPPTGRESGKQEVFGSRRQEAGGRST